MHAGFLADLLCAVLILTNETPVRPHFFHIGWKALQLLLVRRLVSEKGKLLVVG